MLRRPTVAATLVAAAVASAGLTACGGGAGLRAAASRPASAPAPAVRGPVPATTATPVAPAGAEPAVAAASDSGGETPTSAPPAGMGSLAGYRLVGRSEVLGVAGDQGLATVRRADGSTTRVHRGDLDVTSALRAAGWDHVGDPGGWGGWVVDALQGRAGAIGLRATSPAGVVSLGVVAGPITAGFAAVAPDGQRTVTAEWGVVHTMSALPTPGIAAPAGSLGPATTISLDRPLDGVQGCAFADAVTLVCDESAPAEVVAVHLAAPLAGAVVAATVTALGAVPEQSACAGSYEPEGVDIDPGTGDLRVEVIPPGGCAVVTQVWQYQPVR